MLTLQESIRDAESTDETLQSIVLSTKLDFYGEFAVRIGAKQEQK